MVVGVVVGKIYFAMRLVDPEFVPGRPVPKGVFRDIYVCGATAFSFVYGSKIIRKEDFIPNQWDPNHVFFIAICSHVC